MKLPPLPFRALLVSTLLAITAHGQSTFSTTTPFPAGPRSRGVAFSVGKRVFMGMGINTTTGVRQTDIWELDPATGVWTQRASFPGTGREGAVAFSVQDAAFVGMGTETGGVRKKDLWRYVPATNTWTQRADIGGVARTNAVAFTIGTFGYVATGSGANGRLSDAWRYDPASNQWTQRANVPGAARSEACAFAINGFGYVGTGSTTGGLVSDLHRFNPGSNTWTTMASLPAAGRRSTVAFAINNLGHVVGGNSPSLSAEVWSYDPGINSWSQTINAPQPVAEHMGCAISNTGFIASGFIGGGYTNATQRFRPVAPTPAPNSWTRRADQPSVGTYRSAACSIGNKAYVHGGKNVPAIAGNVYSNALRRFDPLSNTWELLAAPPFGPAEARATAVAVQGKLLLAAGERTGFTTVAQQSEYDPGTNTWTVKAPMPASRSDAAGFSINGQEYVTTGALLGLSSQATKELWRYDPATNAWTQLADLPGPGRRGAVSFVINGIGHVCSGRDRFSDPLNDLWAYDPGTNSWQQRAALPGPARSEACAFTIGGKAFLGTGLGPVGPLNDLWSYDPATDAWVQRSDVPFNGRFGAVGFAIGSKGYISGGTNDISGSTILRDTWEYEPGPIDCSANNLTVELITDAQPNETTWEIAPQGDPTPVCSGSTTLAGSTVPFTCCVPNGCYDLRVFDAFGDGILGGGYRLMDANARRIIDNTLGGAGMGSLSQVTNNNTTPWSFCVPVSTDAMDPGSCDQNYSLNSTIVVRVQEDPGVTAQLGIGNNADDGYQICLFDPNGGFRRNVFLSLANPGPAAPANTPQALRPTYFNLNFSNAPFLPTGRHLNVRVRSRINGADDVCGPACRIRFEPPVCSPSQLTTTPSPAVSCGATGVNVNTGLLYATEVPGATRYQFQFSGPNGYLRQIAAPATTVGTLPQRTLQMSGFVTNKPPCNTPITVQVRASFDGGTTYCAFGPSCTVTFTGCTGRSMDLQQEGPIDQEDAMRVWPNPCAGGLLHVALDPAPADGVRAEVFTLTGQRLAHYRLTGATTTLDLGGSLSPGTYLLHVPTDGADHVRRIVIP